MKHKTPVVMKVNVPELAMESTYVLVHRALSAAAVHRRKKKNKIECYKC